MDLYLDLKKLQQDHEGFKKEIAKGIDPIKRAEKLLQLMMKDLLLAYYICFLIKIKIAFSIFLIARACQRI